MVYTCIKKKITNKKKERIEMENFWEMDEKLNKELDKMSCDELKVLLKPSTHGYKVLEWMKLSNEEKCKILKEYIQKKRTA